jgi:hypothetical protein
VFVAGFLPMLAVIACSKPSPATGPTATSVYNELVAAGCLAPDDGGAAAVAEEHAAAPQEPWMACLWDGGTVAACGVPCDGATSHE